MQHYQMKKITYNGEACPRKECAHYLITKDSFEAKLIASLVEAGSGFTAITKRVNDYRVNHLNTNHVGRSCVYLTSLRLKPKVNKIKKRQQGSLNLESEWCRASHRWSLQMCLILGELKEDAIPPKFLVDNKIPDCFSLKKVTKRELKATTIWDETHKDQQAGTIRNGTEIEFRFPWGEDGELDLENGEYADEGTRLNMKYKEQARFSLGMALQIDANGNLAKDEKD